MLPFLSIKQKRVQHLPPLPKKYRTAPPFLRNMNRETFSHNHCTNASPLMFSMFRRGVL